MPPRIDHKKPAAAFALLCVIAVVVLGNGMRARAAEPSWLASLPAILRLPLVHGHLGAAPAQAPSGATRVAPERDLTGAAVPEPAGAAAPGRAHGAHGRAAAPAAGLERSGAAGLGRSAAAALGRGPAVRVPREHALSGQSRWDATGPRLRRLGAQLGAELRAQTPHEGTSTAGRRR